VSASPLLPVDEALARILADVVPVAAETVPIDVAAGRILAVDLAAVRTQPPFRSSAMDGYAVRGADVAEAGRRLAVIGTSAAGHGFAGRLSAGEAVRIFTGAPVPEGADTVLIQEDALVVDEGTIAVAVPGTPGRHVRAEGLDFRAGDVRITAGTPLDFRNVSLAAAMNHATVPVVRRPRVAILATGDELVTPGGDPGPDQIVASNHIGVAALVSRAGGEPVFLGIAPDRTDAIASAVRRAAEEGADVLVTLGGASVGEHDLVRDAFGLEGLSLDFWKIAMRPGKPLIFGRLGPMRVLGLPGNPVSSLVCGLVFLEPLVRALAGFGAAPVATEAAVLGAPMAKNDTRRDYVRAALAVDGERLVATPARVQDSSMISVLASAGCLIVREPFEPAAEAGAACRVIRL
jgi:molybdopterin molybdotransferase